MILNLQSYGQNLGSEQKKLSKRVIAGELRSKGVSQDIINEVIEEIDDESEYSQAFLLAQRKYNSISHLDPEVIYRRISGLLMRKGYGHGVCARIMRELTSNN